MTTPKLGWVARAVLLALTQGVNSGSTNIARTSVPRRDPLLWWLARRRLQSLLERERLLTIHDEPAHQMRRVALTLVGEECPESDDIEETSRQYEQTVRSSLDALGTPYWTWGIVAALVVAIGAGVTYRVAHRPFDPHSIPAAALLEENLSDWTAADGKPDASRIASRFREPRAQKLLGSEASQALSVMLERGLTLTLAKPEELKAKGRAFTESQGAVDRALSHMGLPLFVDASLLPSEIGAAPLVMTYYVEREETFDYRGLPLRAVSAWRMDPMRVRLPALGYVREGNPVAIISYDLIESVLVLRLLPSLMDKQPAFVFDETSRFQDEPKVIEIEARLGNVLRQHFGTRLDADTRRLGELLAQRRNLIAKWRRTITGFPVLPPERLLPERNLSSKLEATISRSEAIRWQEISEGLADAPIVAAFERQRNELSNAIKRHELQHLVDEKDGLSGIPVALARHLRVDASSEPEPFSLFGAARSELSAYMAQIADGPHTRLSLVQVSTAVFDRNLRGQPHHFAALALFDGLMKALHVVDDGPTFNEAVVRVIESDPAAVQTAARNLYEEWFGRPLTAVTLTKAVEHNHWRH